MTKKDQEQNINEAALNENSIKIVELIEKLNVMETLTLVKFLEEKWGVSANTTMATSSSDVQNTTKEEEQSTFEAILTDVSANKIAAIKLFKELKNVGLSNAKAAIDKLPCSLGEFDSKEKAEEISAKFKEISATVEIK